MQVQNFDDLDKTPLKKYRRTDLWALCRQEGVNIDENETKDQLLFKLMGHGIDPAKPPALKSREEIAQIVAAREAAKDKKAKN